MNTFLPNLFFIALLVGAAQGTASIVPSVSAEPLDVAIHIYDYARVEPGVLARAKRETARVFRAIEIETAWLDCPTSKEQLSENRACAAPMRPSDLIVKILPKEMAKALTQPRGIYGLALPGAKGDFGHTIYLFHERVLDLAFYGAIASGYEHNQAIVLGNMMAHEVGHLLLGPKSHSKKGLMKFPWGRRELQRAARAGLQFQPSEVERVRSELARRNQAESHLRSGHADSAR